MRTVSQAIRTAAFGLIAAVLPFGSVGSGESGGLTLEIHPTFGFGGPQRPASVIAGDTLFVSARIENLGVIADGKVSLSVQTELLTSDGRVISVFPSQNTQMHLAFGGKAVSHIAYVHLPSTLVAGTYRIRLGVSDGATRQTAIKELSFELLDAAELGAINLRLCHDLSGGVPAGGTFQVGQTAFMHFGLSGFATEKNRMEVKCSLTVLDDKLKPVGSPPLTVSAKREILFPSENEQLPVNFHLNVNRAGKYWLRLEIDDVISGNQVSYDVPFVAVDAPMGGGGSANTPARAPQR